MKENKPFTALRNKLGKNESFENKNFDLTKWWLEKQFGIKNFSIIELSHLRRIVKQVITEEADTEKQSPDVQSDYRFGSYYAEAGERWLWELYGINYGEEEKRKTKNEELLSRIKFLREQAHNPSLE